MKLNSRRSVIMLFFGVLIGGVSTGLIMNKYYERQLIKNMLMGNAINIMGNVNVLSSLKLNNTKQAIYLLENDLDTDLITIGMFEEYVTESVLENIKRSVKAASDHRRKYPFSTENEEWNDNVSKTLKKYE